jgi:hypothetical protein
MFFVFVFVCFFFFVATWREAPRGVVASRRSSLCYCFWALIIVLLFLGVFLVVMLLLGTFHLVFTLACTRWNCYLTFQNMLVFFSNSINIFFLFLFFFVCVCVCVMFLQDQSLSISCKNCSLSWNFIYIYVCVSPHPQLLIRRHVVAKHPLLKQMVTWEEHLLTHKLKESYYSALPKASEWICANQKAS